MYLKHGLYRFTLVAALFALTACSWIDGYSSTAHQQLLMLEQLHLQFISDAAAAPLDQRLLSYEDRQIRPLFSLALSDSDALRQSNLHVLEKNYQRLYRRVVPRESADAFRGRNSGATDGKTLPAGHQRRTTAFREISMSTIEELSAQLAGAGVNTAEWLQLMHAIVNDEDSDIRDAGMLTLQALQEKARGWLSQDDLILLLQGQRDIASIRANNEQIAMQAHLQSTLLRLFDVTLLALLGRI